MSKEKRFQAEKFVTRRLAQSGSLLRLCMPVSWTEKSISEGYVNFFNASVRKSHEKGIWFSQSSIYLPGTSSCTQKPVSRTTSIFILSSGSSLFSKTGMTQLISYITAAGFHRVTRYMLEPYIYAFSHFLDFFLALARDLSTIQTRKVRAVLLTDSKCLFEVFDCIWKEFLVYIASIRVTCTNGDLINVTHVASAYNLANVFTKSKGRANM